MSKKDDERVNEYFLACLYLIGTFIAPMLMIIIADAYNPAMAISMGSFIVSRWGWGSPLRRI